MSWSYTEDPLNSPRDELRLIIGDTYAADPQLSDQEIDYYLARFPSMNQAAVGAVTQLIAKYSRLADETTAELSVKWSQKAAAYRLLKTDLSDPLNGLSGSFVPFGGGISNTDIKTRRGNPDRFDEQFRIGMHRNRGNC